MFTLSLRHSRLVTMVSCLVLILCTICWVLYAHPGGSVKKKNSENPIGSEFPRPKSSMKEFHLDDFDGNRKAFSISGDSLVIENKKVGFFHFGLLNTAGIKNAEIDIYLPPKQSGVSQSQQGADANHKGAGIKSLDFSILRSSEKLGYFIGDKRISGLELRPVKIRIHDEKGPRSVIESEYAALDIRRNSLAFRGNVQVTSGKNRLTTQKLHLFPGNLSLRTDGSFALETPAGIQNGKGLVTDLFLEPVGKPVLEGGQNGLSAFKKR
ncbi:MAG: LPS export ABC transporter periplasmic protein LptC [Syntrophobacteraceae bacterium]